MFVHRKDTYKNVETSRSTDLDLCCQQDSDFMLPVGPRNEFIAKVLTL